MGATDHSERPRRLGEAVARKPGRSDAAASTIEVPGCASPSEHPVDDLLQWEVQERGQAVAVYANSDGLAYRLRAGTPAGAWPGDAGQTGEGVPEA